MKRRRFLSLFGATAATPFLPAPAMAAAAKAPYGPAAVHAAIYHAKTRAVFSVWGLAKAANLPLESAEALMGDLARRGVLGPMQGTTFGGRWAASRIMETDALALKKAADRAQAHRGRRAPQDTPQRAGQAPGSVLHCRLRRSFGTWSSGHRFPQ